MLAIDLFENKSYDYKRSELYVYCSNEVIMFPLKGGFESSPNNRYHGNEYATLKQFKPIAYLSYFPSPNFKFLALIPLGDMIIFLPI